MDLSQLYMLEMMRKRRLADTFPAYRTDDLVLMLDGIKNQRSGGHNASATVWEDLAGNMDITLYDATWGSDHAAFTGEDDSYGIGDYWTFTTHGTIEVVYSCEGEKTAYGIAGWSNGSQGHRLSLFRNATLRFLDFNLAASVSISKGHPANQILVYAAFSKTLLMQNNYQEEFAGSDSSGTTVKKFLLGHYWTFPGTGFLSGFGLPGNIYAVRVYDANLTAEELYAHWLIDKKRFNIPEG